MLQPVFPLSCARVRAHTETAHKFTAHRHIVIYQKKCAHAKISAHTDYKKLEGTSVTTI